MKRVKRTWTTKSGIKTKVYEIDKTYKYDNKHKSTRGKALVGPKGQKYSKNINAFKDKIMADTKHTIEEREALCKRLDQYIAIRSETKKKLTTNGFYAYMKKDKISKLTASLGYTPKELANAYNIPLADIENESNWKDGYFISGKKTYKISHTYTGNVFELI